MKDKIIDCLKLDKFIWKTLWKIDWWWLCPPDQVKLQIDKIDVIINNL